MDHSIKYITRELKCSHPSVKSIKETGTLDMEPGGLASYILTLELLNGEEKVLHDNYPFFLFDKAEAYLQTI